MNAAPRPCSNYPCPNKAEYRGRCAQCNASRERFRGTPQERGYDTAWVKLRRAKLAANPLCEIQTHCKGMIPECRATEVDHRIPIEVRPDLRLVWENLQSACHACHSAKTARESSGWGPQAA
jgi:5-methylcytosine-specific restriction enzyme A